VTCIYSATTQPRLKDWPAVNAAVPLSPQPCSVEVVCVLLDLQQYLVLNCQPALPMAATHSLVAAGDFPGAGTDIRRSAAQQLQQQVSAATAPSIMALARQQSNTALQERCVEVMSAHRKSDVFAVLDFAIRFNLRSLQGSCLGSIWRTSRGRLVDRAGQVMQVSGGCCCTQGSLWWVLLWVLKAPCAQVVRSIEGLMGGWSNW
jgi:hypothetical protein